MNKDERNLLQQIGRTSRAMYAAFEAEVGVALPRWRILRALRDHESASQRRLAAQLAMDPGALTRLLKTLEAEGLVQRQTDAQDNRLTIVALTRDGATLIDATQSQRTAFTKKALRALAGEQLDQTMDTLRELEERFRSMQTP